MGDFVFPEISRRISDSVNSTCEPEWAADIPSNVVLVDDHDDEQEQRPAEEKTDDTAAAATGTEAKEGS